VGQRVGMECVKNVNKSRKARSDERALTLLEGQNETNSTVPDTELLWIQQTNSFVGISD